MTLEASAVPTVTYTYTIASMTQGSVLFAGVGGLISQDNSNFFYDATNHRLGLGTPTPSAPITLNANATKNITPIPNTVFHVVGMDATATGFTFDTFGSNPTNFFRRANNTAASPSALALGNVIGRFAGVGYGSTTYSSTRAAFDMLATEAWTDAAQGAGFRWLTTANGTTTTNEKMRLNDVGFLGIGTNAPTQMFSVAEKFQVNSSGTVAKFNNVATAGYGVPALVDVQNLTGKTADIGTTNFTNAGTAGLYRVGYSLQDTTADVTAGIVTLTIAWTDGAGATTSTATQVLTGLGRSNGEIFIQLASGNITYATTHTGIYGSAVYALYLTCERLN